VGLIGVLQKIVRSQPQVAQLVIISTPFRMSQIITLRKLSGANFFV